MYINKFSLLTISFLIALSAKAEIPFNHAQSILSATKDEIIKIPNQKDPLMLKDISPFWGLVALYSGLLERIRFFGNYKIVEQGDRQVDEGQDTIARLIKWLFNSPDGVLFVATTYENDPVGNLSRNLATINDLIEILLTQKEPALKITEKLNKLSSNDATVVRKNKDFAHVLVSAYNKQYYLANSNKVEQQLYPKNIVIISLLAFFSKIADNKSELEKLPFLMDINALDKKSVFTREDYFSQKETLNKVLENARINNTKPELNENQELNFLMGAGYNYYESIFSKPNDYRGDTTYLTLSQFPDCGETSLRNLLALFFSAQAAGIIYPKAISNLENNLKYFNENIDLKNHESFQKMKQYFLDYNDVAVSNSKSAHARWANIVSNLNNDKTNTTLSRIIYGRKSHRGEEYEIKSDAHEKIKGIMNMLNAIAYLIPDKVLTSTWEQDIKKRYSQIAIKLDRLSELFSNENVKLSWKNETSNDNNITSEFTTIIFSANNKSSLAWTFKKGHFELRSGISEINQNDWRLAYDRNDIAFTNEWMASIFKNFSQSKEHFPLSGIYNKNLVSSDGTIKTIAFILENQEHLKAYLPLIGRWINKSISLDNEELLEKIAVFMRPYHKELKEMPLLPPKKILIISEKVDDFSKIHMAQVSSKNGYIKSLEYVVDLAPNILNLLNSIDKEGNTLLHLAAQGGSRPIAEFLLDRGSNPNTFNKGGSTPLHVAASYDRVEIVDLLLSRGVDVDQTTQSGSTTPLLSAVQQNRLKTLNLLLAKGADINKRFIGQRTALMIAARDGLFFVAELLIKHGADTTLKDKHEMTALAYALEEGDQSMINLLRAVQK